MTSSNGSALEARFPLHWRMLSIALFSQITVSIVTQGVPTLAPFLQADLALTRGQVGLFNSAIMGGSFVALFVAGGIVDLKGERAALSLGNAIVGAACFMMVFAQSFALALGVCFIAGVGAAFATPAGGRTVMRWFPAAQRGTAMGIRQTGIPIGGALAAAVLPVIAVSAGWRAAIAIGGVSCLVAAGVSILAYQSDDLTVANNGTVPLLQFRGVINREIALLGLAGCVLPLGQFALVTYLALYLKETQQIAVTTSALMLVAAQLAGAAGRVAWGTWSDRIFRQRRKPPLVIANLLAAGFSFGLGWLPHGFPVWGIAILVALYGFNTIGWHGTWISMVAERAHPAQQGRTIAAAMIIMYVGIISLPPLFGVVVDYTHSWRLAWTLLGGLLLLGVALLLLAREAPSRAQEA